MSDTHLYKSAPRGPATRRPARKLLVGIVGAVFLAAASSACAQDIAEAQHLPSTRLQAGMHYIDAESARTPREREIGLMFRRELGDHAGMLFTFEAPAVQCFWMRNTLIPLTAAFIADDGSIVNLADMAPQTLDSHCSTRPVRYVLEMAAGWFAKSGLKAGSRLSGAPFTTQN